MHIQDRIYGEFTITEPVLTELVESPSMQRLKGIDQFGMPQRFYPYPSFSRYEHSVGAMLIIRKLGGDVEEQAAGLIHDVSHTAFSHLVDWVMGDREREDHQDKNLYRIVSLSTIPAILRKHGFDPEKVTDVKHYSLLERPAPHLCADRVDYSLREFNTWANPRIVGTCVEDLINHEGLMAFRTKGIAEQFAYTYAKLQREHWGGAECTVRWELLARALKIALGENTVTVDDFYLEDEYVIRKLRESGNREIGNIFWILEQPRLNLVENRTNPEFDLKKKFRHIDPHYVANDGLHVLSEDRTYAQFLRGQRDINERRIKVDLVN